MALAPDSRAVLALLAALTAFGVGAAEASAAVKIKSANAVDVDTDGAVDGFDVTFTAKLRGKARTGRVPFSVRGFKVKAMGRPRGRRVRVRVAEGRSCDLGAKPRISFRGGQLTDMRKRKLRRSRIDLGRRDRRAPRLSCAVTGDRDADGHIDSITLTWSRPVRSPASAGGGQFGVDRYSIVSVGAAKGRYVTLKLKEKTAFDTGEVPAVFYRRPKQRSRGVRATARRRGVAASTTYNDTRDKAAARLQSARTEDSNLNGFVDGVVARFSESVKASPSAIAVTGASVRSVATRGRDGFTAALAEGPLRSDARPTVTFGTASKVVRDLAGNVAPRASVRAADGAAPVIVAARTLDRGGIAGRLDTLSLTWSEAVSHSADSDGSYPLGVTGYSVASAPAAAGTLLDLALTEGATPDSGARPPVGYTRGAGSPVKDAAGNEAASHVFAGAADAIAPRLLSAHTLDTDSDGKVDRVRFEFTEAITSPQRSCSTGCGFSASSLTAVTALAGAGNAVELTVAEGALNGGVKPLSTYSPGTGAVRDSAGAAAPGGSVTAADGAPPVALDSYTADADSDARIDEVRVTFSETLNYPGDGVGQTSFTATGYTVQSASPATGATLTLNLVEAADPDTGSAPAVGYNGQGGVKLRDSNGVEHANRSWPGLTRDAVAPDFVAARTADLNAGSGDEVGKVDAVELVYSEAITGSADVNDFQVNGAAPAAIAFEPDSVKLRIAEGSAYDTDITPTYSYSSATGDLTDEPEGPGDTADDAPDAGGTATDGAKPAIVEAQTADTEGTPNGKVDHVSVKFSEPITYSPGLPAIGLTTPAMTVAAVTVDGPTDLTLTVTEASAPNGGAKPLVMVTDTARVLDGAANEALADPFGGVTDDVAPVLVSARLGEASGGACGTAVVNSRVDCVRATWSEAVTQPSTFSALSLSTFTIDSLLTPPAGTDVDAGFAEGGTPNRDTSSSLTYTGGGAGEVFDPAGTPSITPGTVTAGAVCKDIQHEPNDSQAVSNPQLTAEETTEKLCSLDSDWFRVAPSGGQLSVRVDPNQALAPTVSLHEADGTQLDLEPPTTPGSTLVVSATGLTDPYYYLHVRAAAPQEGAYCVDRVHVAGDPECDDEDQTPQ